MRDAPEFLAQCSAADEADRPRSRFSNLFLAGEWTNTGCPATIEGADRSGYRAAAAVLAAT